MENTIVLHSSGLPRRSTLQLCSKCPPFAWTHARSRTHHWVTARLNLDDAAVIEVTPLCNHSLLEVADVTNSCAVNANLQIAIPDLAVNRFDIQIVWRSLR
jgi:hypothetical protein